MRLLFDQNLSHFLVSRLASEYPGSVHARDLVTKYGDTHTDEVRGTKYGDTHTGRALTGRAI